MSTTLRSLERRGLVRSRTFPNKGFQLTDAGKVALAAAASEEG